MQENYRCAANEKNIFINTRLGVYGGYKRGAHEVFVYLSHGWLKNDLSRGISEIGMAEADYNSHLLELGGEYKYDLQGNKVKTWHVSPYANMQLSRLWQDGYQERGVGVLGQKANSAANTYFAMGLGLEFKRYLNKGSYAMRIGASNVCPDFAADVVNTDSRRIYTGSTYYIIEGKEVVFAGKVFFTRFCTLSRSTKSSGISKFVNFASSPRRILSR